MMAKHHSKHRRRIGKKRVGLFILSLLLALPAWHVIYRMGAHTRSISVETISPSAKITTPTEDGSLTILAYNIAHGRGVSHDNYDAGSPAVREKRLLDIAALIESTHADIVILNEVDFDADWSYGIDQAVFLADYAGYPYIAKQRNIDILLPFFTHRFGNAVLSRIPITEAVLLDLPAHSIWESFIAGKKKGSVVTVLASPGFEIKLIAVHLEHRDEFIRVESARALLDYCERSTQPFIAAGDFNSHHPLSHGASVDSNGRNAIALIEASACLQNDYLPDLAAAAHTFPSTNPTKAIDWIFTNDGFTIQDVRVIESELSDHFPIMATLRYSQHPAWDEP